MKTTLFFLTIIFVQTLAGQVIPQKITSVIKGVTVFMTGAEVTHSAHVSLNNGKNLVLLTGLSPKIDPKSISIEINPKDVTILSVSSKINYLAEKVENSNIRQLKDSLEIIEDQAAMLANQIETLDKEKDLLFKNGPIGGLDKGVMVSEIEKGADFFRKRSNDINGELFKLRKNKKKLHEIITRLLLQIEELNGRFNPPTSEILLEVVSNSKQQAEISFKFLVSGAGWAPKYDIRAESVLKPINFIYRANVFNATGIDWKDIKLKLSTADPKEGAEKPQLETWQLDSKTDNSLSDDEEISGKVSKIKQKAKSDSIINYQKIAVNELSSEFEIAVPYTILSDSKPYTVEVTSYNLPAVYEHFCIPKIDNDAFLVAKITGWNSLNLVSGEASVYFNGAYIGQSFVNTSSIDDTLSLSLGRDKKIMIKRDLKVDESKNQIIGNTVKERNLFEIFIRNNRDVPVTIEVQDQVPVSKDNEISVTLNEISNAEYNKFNGKLSWRLNIAPGETRQIILSYMVKYPKTISVPKKKFRTISCPTF